MLINIIISNICLILSILFCFAWAVLVTKPGAAQILEFDESEINILKFIWIILFFIGVMTYNATF